MKNIVLIMLGAIAFTAIGCASQTDNENGDVDVEEGTTSERSDALMNTGGGGEIDPDYSTASLQACYQSCAKSRRSDCYRFCDITYTRCRGLPSPELGGAIAW